jgi:hypothetical protein
MGASPFPIAEDTVVPLSGHRGRHAKLRQDRLHFHRRGVFAVQAAAGGRRLGNGAVCYGVEQVCFLLVHYGVETNIFDILRNVCNCSLRVRGECGLEALYGNSLEVRSAHLGHIRKLTKDIR